MEITLEKIELVKDRTGVTYKEAKDALEAADGSVVDAIINIEESIDCSKKKSIGQQSSTVLDAVKDLIRKGNVSKIVVRNKDDEMMINVPVNVGIAASLIAPCGILTAAVAAFGFKCNVEVVKTDGTIIDVSNRANEAVGKAVEMGSEFADVAREKGTLMYEKVKNSETYEKAKEKTEDVIEKATESIKGKFQKSKETAESV